MRLVFLLNIFLATALLFINGFAKSRPTIETFENRNYEITIPGGDTKKPAPTVFVLHGGGGTGKTLRQHFDFTRLAADGGVVLVYPDGINGHWNDGRKGGRDLFKGEAPNDVTFLSALAQELVKRGIAKPGQIYVTGVSNGGMMTQRLLCEASETFTAGASIIANLPAALKSCNPSMPRPILLINGDDDPLMPWKGGGVGFWGARGLVLSGTETYAYWQNVNGCAKQYEITDMPNKNAADQSRAVKYITKCKQATEMIHIKRGGHNIPMPISTYRPKSRKYKRRKRLLGRYNHDFDSRSEIWEFFIRAGL
jgi:polyhydroxybutyrate depolymerase